MPQAAKDYLIFTIVRNPYEREVSSWFFVPWSAETIDPPQPTTAFGDAMRATIPLKDGNIKIQDHEVPEVRMNQKHFVERAGVSLVLHFERLPECLKDLSFVDKDNVPPFPHMEERGHRPAGSFFDHFTMEDEKLVWDYASEDFAAFGYQRFNCGLPGVTSK